jgi:hypothetical protein
MKKYIPIILLHFLLWSLLVFQFGRYFERENIKETIQLQHKSTVIRIDQVGVRFIMPKAGGSFMKWDK